MTITNICKSHLIDCEETNENENVVCFKAL